jgi:Uroporphyrinogen-III decarboxylase
MMTSRERLTRLFKGQELDRIPIWLLAPYHRLGCYADIYNNPYYNKITDYIDKYCDTFDRRGFGHGFAYNVNPDIKYTSDKFIENGKSVSSNTISYRDISFTSKVIRGSDSSEVEYLIGIDEIERLNDILSIPYVPAEPDLTKFFAEKEELGDKGLMMVDIGDPLTTLYNAMSAGDFSMASALYYDEILEFLDVIYERVYNMYKYLLERDVGEVYFIVGCEFAGPPLVHPDKFNEMSVRYVKGICDLIRSYGKWSIVHYHGNLYKVLPGMKEMNPDGLHTIEAPPIGDCTITQAREALGKDMILIGNIQYDDIVRKEPAEIDEMVRDAIEQGRSGKFILSPTAGPYENVLTDRTIENYLAFIEAGIRYGRF